MRRSWPIVIAILVVGAIALILTQRRQVPVNGSATVTTVQADAVLPPHSDVPPVPEAVRQVVPAPVLAPLPAEPELPVQPEDQVDLQGTVIVVDESGREHRQESGSITLVLWTENSGNTIPRLAVSGGRFGAHVPRTVKLAVRQLMLGNRFAFVEGDERIAVPASGPLELYARWPRPTLLHVVDGATGAELAGVTLVCTKNWMLDALEHPGDDATRDVLLRDATSPVALVPIETDSFISWSQVLHARSPQHAWGRIEVDYKTGGDLRLPLPGASAELEVTLHGRGAAQRGNPSSPLLLRLRRDHAEPGAGKQPGAESSPLAEEIAGREPVGSVTDPETDELLDELTAGARGQPQVEVTSHASGTTVITGVIPGRYKVAAEIGNWFEKPLVLAEQDVDLSPGGRSMIDLELRVLPDEEPKVPLSGTLLVPPAWGDPTVRLDLAIQNRPDLKRDNLSLGVEQMQITDRAAGRYRWIAGLVRPGRYHAAIDAFEWQRTITVGKEGSTDVQIVIGPPADVTVRFVDEGSAADIAVDELSWSSECSVFEGRAASVAPTQGTTSFHFRAPAGRAQISWTERYRLDEKWLSLVPGSNTIVIPLSRPSGVILRLKEGTSSVSWPGFGLHCVDVDRSDGQQLQRIGCSTSSEVLAFTLEPARYRITVQKIPGFRPVPSFEVEIKQGEMIEREIDLQREN